MTTSIITVIPARFGTASLSGIDVRKDNYFFTTPNYQGSYGRIFPITGQPTQSGIGLLALDESNRLNIWDFQMRGGFAVHGDGIVSEGSFSQVVTNDEVVINLSSLEAIVDGVFVKEDPGEDVVWNAPANQLVSLLIKRAERDRGIGITKRSSTLFNDLDPVVSTSGVPPKHLLIATRSSGVNSSVLDVTPTNKKYLQIQRHIDQKNPHGKLLKQTNIRTSGITVFSGIEIFSDVLLSGIDFDSVKSVDFPGILSFSKGILQNDAQFLSDTIHSGLAIFDSTVSGTQIDHNTIIFDDPDNLISGLGVIDDNDVPIAPVSVPAHAQTTVFGDVIISGTTFFKAHQKKEFAGQEFLTALSDGVNLLEHHRLLHCHLSGLHCQFIEPDKDQDNSLGTIIYTAKGGLVDGITPDPNMGEDDPFGGRTTDRDRFAELKSGKGFGTLTPFIGGGGFFVKNQQFWLNILDDFKFTKVSVFVKLKHPELREFDSTWAEDNGATAGVQNNLRIGLTGTTDNFRILSTESDPIRSFENDLLRSNAPQVKRNNLGQLQDTDGGLKGTFVGDLGRGNEIRPNSSNTPFKTSLDLTSIVDITDLDVLFNNVTPEQKAGAVAANKNLLIFFNETGKNHVNSRRQWILNFSELTQFTTSASPVLEEWGIIFEGVQSVSTTPFEISGIGLKGKDDPLVYQKFPNIVPGNAGFALQGNLNVESGITIDGIDISTLAPLRSGVNVDNLHVHKLLPDSLYVHNAPWYKNAILSGNEFGLLDSSRFGNQNWLSWYSVVSGTAMVINQAHVPTGATKLKSIKVNARTSGRAEFTKQSGVKVLIFDTDKQPAQLPNHEFNPSKHGEEIIFSGNPFINGSWDENKTFDIILNLRSTSGVGIHTGRITAEFIS